MRVGKLPSNLLEEKILSRISPKRKEILVGAALGEDCSVIDFGEEVCVLSTDPITGASKGIGKLAIHISCNDVASNGVEPLGILLTIMVPEGTTMDEISQVIEEAKETAATLNVEIIGGHTEITTAVNRMVLSSTCIGKGRKESMVTSHGASPGDEIIMTKWAGLEGTAILAHDHEDELKDILGAESLAEAKAYMEHISVIPEGIIGGRMGATAMHDVTEGGLLGALWEIAQASKVGVEIHQENIPITSTTQKICEYYNIDPLRLISSGVMIITTMDSQGMLDALRAEGIPATIIGRVVQGDSYVIENGDRVLLSPPETDELFKVV